MKSYKTKHRKLSSSELDDLLWHTSLVSNYHCFPTTLNLFPNHLLRVSAKLCMCSYIVEGLGIEKNLHSLRYGGIGSISFIAFGSYKSLQNKSSDFHPSVNSPLSSSAPLVYWYQPGSCCVDIPWYMIIIYSVVSLKHGQYNTVNFLTNTNKGHPIARLLGRIMGCVL